VALAQFHAKDAKKTRKGRKQLSLPLISLRSLREGIFTPHSLIF
jgi:hypothetical protein